MSAGRTLRHVAAGGWALALAVAGCASVAGEAVEYADGGTALEGYLALPDGNGKVPGVLVVHQWMGVTKHEKEVADRLAAAGYATFACDVYGKDDRPEGRSEAGAYAGKYKGDVDLLH